MPRVSAYYPTLRSEKALQRAIARGKVDAGIRSDTELAEKISTSRGTYYHYKHDKFDSMKLGTFKRLVKVLNFTPEELADIFGVEES